MYHDEHTIIDKLRWLLGGVVVFAIILSVIAVLVPAAETQAQTAAAPAMVRPSAATYAYDNPNAVSNGMAAAGVELEQSLSGLGQTVGNVSGSFTTSLSNAGSMAGNGIMSGVGFVGRGIGSGASFVGRGITAGVVAVVNIPANIFGAASESAVVGAVITPSTDAAVPVIGSDLPATTASTATVAPIAAQPQPSSHAAIHSDMTAAWPISGRITTLFGVPHWPYQPTHTGIDISDGKPAGTTPIKPFKPGRVVGATYSYSGLGNHVTIDHGDGLTSVYGHLASISIQPGQAVDKSTVLGYEGSTGASTGTHLHLEIRQNGQAVDPRKFIAGQP